MLHRFKLLAVTMLFIITLTGCGGGGKSNATPVLTTIIVNPASISLMLNDTHQFTAIGKDQNGNTMSITPTWSVTVETGTLSSETGITTTYTAKKIGNGVITATVGSVSGSADITVVENTPTLTTIAIEPASVTITNGTTHRFTVVGTDQYGSAIALDGDPVWSVTAGSGSVAPTSGNPTTFTAATVGNFTVSATIGSLSATAQVTVTEAPVLTRIVVSPNTAELNQGQTQVFTARGYDQFESPYTITPTWNVSGGIGTLSTTSGTSTTLTATTAGNGQVTATAGSVSGSATVTVNRTQLRVPEDYSTVQAAINAAPDGGTVIISQGTYNGGIEIKDKSLTLRSTNPDSASVVENTVISGNNTKTAISITGNGTVTVEGFTITGGNQSSGDGGGIYIEGATTVIRKNIISNNSAWRGAGIYIGTARATIEYNQIVDNIASSCGGGIFTAPSSMPIINNNTISRNKAGGSYVGGGGLYLWSNVELNNNIITENQATAGAGYGGGIYANAYVKVNNCTVNSNRANYGGGVYVESYLVSTQTVYNNNSSYAIRVSTTASYSDGGGNSFSGNTPGNIYD